jgi:chloramphenicol 3-O-phosphotransferase
MRAFADRAPTPFACLDEPFVGHLPTRYLAWPATVGPHVDGVLVGLAAAAALGNQFIVSSGGIPQHRFRTVLEQMRVLYIGLDAPLEELVRRQRLQADKFGGLAEQSTGIHEGWEYDLRIDTTQHDPDAAAERLASLLGMDLLRREAN